MRHSACRLAIFVALFLGNAFSSCAATPSICRIEVVEKGTDWPVPLVELRTTHLVRFVTDNAGIIAFDSPELIGRETWLEVIGHGYEVPKDGFGIRGVRLVPEPGKTLRVEVTRTIIARRLGRATGGGMFAESQKLGGDLDWKESGVLGCDSVQTAVHRGKMFWFWGDTTLANYPLGIFHCSGAMSTIQPLATFKPPLRLPLDYFQDENGKPRGTAQMAGAGPTWISGCVSLPDSKGVPHLVCSYLKIRGFLEAYRAGLCVWNDGEAKFEPLRVLWNKSETSPKPPSMPEGPAVFWQDESGKQWVLFGSPLPNLRCPETYEAWQDSSTWETLTPQKHFVSAADGKNVVPHSGSIAWNPWRKRWVTVFVEQNGKSSLLGEVWYAEADSPFGPWGKAVKVLSHENYTYYNPRLHPEFTASSSPVLIFEGTYTQTFADRPQPTPRYDYNQMMYRLDLDDARLRPAQGVETGQ
jgi:hypothetical protein